MPEPVTNPPPAESRAPLGAKSRQWPMLNSILTEWGIPRWASIGIVAALTLGCSMFKYRWNIEASGSDTSTSTYTTTRGASQSGQPSASTP